MMIRCENCGAPIDAPDPTRPVACGYCRRVNHPTAQQPQHGFGPPPGYVAPPGHAPQAPRPGPGPHPPRPQNASGPLFASVAVAAIIALTGAGAAFFALRSHGGGGLGGSGVSWWSMGAATCEVDANGDGVSDLVGMSGKPGEYASPTLVDGASGKVMWTGARLSTDAKMLCLSREYFAVAQPNFELQISSARSPGTPARVMGRDEVRKFGLGPRCASFVLADGSSLGVQLPDGTPAACQAPQMSEIYGEHQGVLGLTQTSVTITSGARRYTLQKRRAGSSPLSITAEEAGKPAWSLELPYVSPTFASAVAASPATVLVWAAEPGKPQSAVLVGLDARNGNQLFARPLNSSVSNSVGMLTFNGKHFIAQWWTALVAYDPSTGAEAWTVGSTGYVTKRL